MLDSIETAVKGKDRTLEQMRRFVADASHELRTPLVTVRGYAELYRMGAIKGKQDIAEAMGRIESEAIRMSGLVESLLTLTRMDELDNLKKEDNGLVALIKAAIKDASVANQSISFRLNTSLDELVIKIDANRIKQVLLNLLTNASRFAPAATEVTVDLTLENDLVTVKVIDRGEGIPESLREKIFERFYRVDNSRNRVTGGSGLGLAIAKSIVEAHGGRIWVEETPGGGATLAFNLSR
jgi:two-component system OmpR family sensor kinase